MTEEEKDKIIEDFLRNKIEDYNRIMEIKDNTRFKRDLGMDSLDMTELAFESETRFGILITDLEMEKLKTFEGFKKLIKNKWKC